jgi:DNA-binding NtrC family response regulator
MAARATPTEHGRFQASVRSWFSSGEALDEATPSLRGLNALVVDDDPLVLRVIGRILRSTGCTVSCASGAEEALASLATTRHDLCLVDVRLGARSGEEVLTRALALSEPPLVVMMSGAASIDAAVRAMRLGASDFIEKPLQPETFLPRVGCIVEAGRARRKLDDLGACQTIVAASPGSSGMRQAIVMADRVAETPSSSALIVGESGVGKEVLANHIHRKSTRHAQPFVRLNVAAIPESMMEAELFGSTRGAFTDSKQSRVGHIASADRGTLLLDEIGELRVDYQPKLLRVLEERRFFPMGSDRERVVDVRFLAATNRRPEDMVAKGVLRRDLFYRFGIVIRIPPLRERRDEILPLARHFVTQFTAEFGRGAMYLTPEAEALLASHRWPGNIRELRNVIERGVMSAPGEEIGTETIELFSPSLSSSGFPAVGVHGSAAPPVLALSEAVRAAAEEVERHRIVSVLRAVGGSRSRAAQTLGVSRSTLYEKLKRYAIE